MDHTGFFYKCTDCGKEYDSSAIMYLCPECSRKNTASSPPRGVLKTVYDYQKILQTVSGFAQLKERSFVDLLPVNNISSFPKLKIGKTPLYSIDVNDARNHSFKLHLKDDSQNPTYSFKDRASALVSAYASENNIETIVTASTGNAGSSLAGICASQRQKAVIMVPETAPVAKMTQIIMYGATIIPVKGTYDEAFDLSIKATEEFGWYNRNTAYNPLTIEGKKMFSFELVEQLRFRLPDRIFVPVGDGVILSGVYKGFEDLLHLSIIDRIPVIVAVQSEKSNNLVRNIGSAEFSVVPSSTIADSISVDIPRNFYMAQQYIRKYNGESITVTDNEIIKAASILAKNTGLFAEPAAAAAFAGFLTYQQKRMIANESSNVVMLTGSGLKDLKSVSSLINMPESIYPSIDNLKKMMS